MTGTTACSTADCLQVASIVLAVDLGRMVNARFPLAQAVQAFALAKDRTALKIAMEMPR